MGWVKILWFEEHDYLPKYWIVFRKTNLEPYIMRLDNQVWSFVGGDLLLCDFIWLIFPSFSVERVTLEHFRKLSVDLIVFYNS